MNLKTACTIALVITLLSILLTIGGNALFYTTMLTEHFNITMFIHMVTGILTFLLDVGGFMILLLAILSRLKNPETNTKMLFVLAGVLILLGMLINATSNMISSVELFRYLPILRFILYMSVYLFVFISSLCMSLFAFTCSGNTSSGKSLTALTLAAKLVLAGLVILSTAIYLPQLFHNAGRGIGSLVMSLGYFVNMGAVIFFLLAFLKYRPWPPTAGVVVPSPEPVPTLSAEADLPEG